MTVAVVFLIIVAIGVTTGVLALLLVIAVVQVLVRAGRLLRKAFYAAAAWRAGDWSPLLEARVRWGSRRMDGQLDWLLGDQCLPQGGPQDGAHGRD
jgi:hypothetical protein